MVEALAELSPLGAVLAPGRHGRADGTAGLRVTERRTTFCASLAAREAGTGALAAALGWDLPTRPRCLVVGDTRIVWTGPGRWLVFAATELEHALRTRAGATGSVADQSDSRVVLRLEGARVRDVLAKGVSIDLHPRTFAVDDAAATPVAHIPALLWREADDAFCVAVPGSFAGSLAEWLSESALEFGLQVG